MIENLLDEAHPEVDKSKGTSVSHRCFRLIDLALAVSLEVINLTADTLESAICFPAQNRPLSLGCRLLMIDGILHRTRSRQ